MRAALDPVRKGQALAEVYAPDWVAAQEEYLSVKRMQGAGTEALLAAARQRMLLAGMNDEQVKLVESSGKVQARFTLTAPIGGVIAELGVREGMTVMPGFVEAHNHLALTYKPVPENNIYYYTYVQESTALRAIQAARSVKAAPDPVPARGSHPGPRQ